MTLGKKFIEENKIGKDDFRIMRLEINRGKGGAVTQVFNESLIIKGMLVGRGSTLLFVDADGATKFSDLKKLEDVLPENGISIGSRAHMVNSESVIQVNVI
jgi:dolichyl-phosphate beta-glucosyltransferase